MRIFIPCFKNIVRHLQGDFVRALGTELSTSVLCAKAKTLGSLWCSPFFYLDA